MVLSHWKISILPIVLSVLAATVGAAQEMPQSCDVDLGTPGDVAHAMLSLSIAANTTDTAAAKMNLRAAIQYVGESKSTVNTPGRTLMIGRVLSTWLGLPNAKLVMTRGDLGYSTNPTGTVDLIGTMDSLFTVVETKSPQCIPDLRKPRMNTTWQTLITTAVRQLNADSLAAAQRSVSDALRLSRDSPYGHAVLAQIDAKQGKVNEGIGEFKRAISEADADTAWAAAKCPATYQLGSLATDAADSTKDGAAKAAWYTQAKDAFTLGLTCEGSQARIGELSRTALTQLAVRRGDATSLTSAYADMENNAFRYSATQLVQTGTAAAAANQNADAIKLFEAAVAASPYHRDALSHLARSYAANQEFARAIPILDRLIAVDPNGSANYPLAYTIYGNLRNAMVRRNSTLRARADSITGSGAPDPARKQALVDSAKVAADSAMRLLNAMTSQRARIDSLAAAVSFTETTLSADRAVVGGTIGNNTAAARAFSFTIEFLDRSGKVVTTAAVTTKTIAPKVCQPPDANGEVRCGALTTANFTATGTGTGIVAVRYREIK